MEIEKKKLVLFKNAIAQEFGRSIKNRPDCEQLAGEVYVKTGQVVSYNTIRRFYGLAGKQSTQLSMASLNILANFIGYDHFEQYLLGRGKAN